LRHFAPSEQQRLVVVARRDRELVAVAPFVRRTFGHGPVKGTGMTLIGKAGSSGDRLSEMTEILLTLSDRRRTLRAVVEHLAEEHSGRWDWLTLTITPEQGWIDPEWVPDSWRRHGARPLYKHAHVYVVLPLPGTWEELPLKHNMKEAIR